MRIISGIYKGKKLKGFDIDGTRPTMDRVKESLFGMIQEKVPESTCLDLFAGSGALGLEALSMGAKECYFIDNNMEAINILNENTLNVKNAHVIKCDYKKYLKETKLKYDIIFLDPPYKNNNLNKAIKIIEELELLNQNGLIVCEYETEKPVSNFELIKEKKYGHKYIKIYKNS